jgi:hypothetical protein
LIFPHTRLRESGHLIASAAQAVIDSGCDTVLAIGVLHGMKREDTLRGMHTVDSLARDEFSLENFSALLEVAATLAHRPQPRLIVRYALMSGTNPEQMEGFEELRQLRMSGAALVATADMVHHGAAYDSPTAEWLQSDCAEARNYARTQIAQQLWHLAEHDYEKFELACANAHSDFRDVGPVISALLGERLLSTQIHDLELVDYSEALEAPQPTWVAAALATLSA